MNTEKKTIFLTGGTGFLGKSILSMMKRNLLPDIELTILSRDPEKFLHDNTDFKSLKNVDYIKGDVRDFLFPQKDFTYVIHGAAPTKPLHDGEVRKIIIDGTKRVIDFAKRRNVKRLLFISSGAVYGEGSSNIMNFSENEQCLPTTEYGIAKYEAEKICFAAETPAVVARCFAFIGDYFDINSHNALISFIKNAIENKDIIIKGTGVPIRSYMYADDLVSWLFSILLYGKENEVYNVGSDEPFSILQIAQMVKQIVNHDLQITVRGEKDSQQAATNYIPDISKCRNELNLDITIPIGDAIKRTVIFKKTHIR